MNPTLNSLAMVALLACAGCATPVEHTSGPRTVLDKDTRYTVTDRPDGFTLALSYERYQFIPETSAVITACKAALTSLAHNLAEQRGRKIAPVNEQRIQLSTGRNGLTGITSCEASVPVAWQ